MVGVRFRAIPPSCVTYMMTMAMQRGFGLTPLMALPETCAPLEFYVT